MVSARSLLPTFAVCAGACSSDVATRFPPGLAPIEDVGTGAHAGTADAPTAASVVYAKTSVVAKVHGKSLP